MRRLFAFLNRLLGRSDVYHRGEVYMRRWRAGPRRWFGIRLHHILRSDADPELHDHPFSFATLVLCGGYWEYTVDGRRTRYGPGSLLIRSAEVLHRLELERPAWTLVLRGPMRREWGFLTTIGWMPWRRFVDAKRGASRYADGPHQFSAESSI